MSTLNTVFSTSRGSQIYAFSINGTSGALGGPDGAKFTIVKNGTGDYSCTLVNTSHEPVQIITTPVTSNVNISLSSAPTATLVRLLSKASSTTQASLTKFGLTFYANQIGKLGNNVTVTITAGATAGSEVVTCSSAGVISIQVEDGVSTSEQVFTALMGTSAGAKAARNFVSAVVTTAATAFTASTVAPLEGGVDVGDAIDATIKCVLFGSF